MSATSLCRAMAVRSMVSFTHRGERYTVEPYSVGNEERNAHGRPLLLRAWHASGWRDFEVKFMSRVEIDSRPFSADRQAHQTMAVVLCDVYGKTSAGMDKPL